MIRKGKQNKTKSVNPRLNVEPNSKLPQNPLLWIMAISLLGASLYFSTYKYDFSADDGMYTYFNSATKGGMSRTGDLFRFGSMHFLNINPINSGAYRPFTLLTFAVEKQITGEFKPVYGHIFNIILYFLVLFVVGLLLLQLFKRKGLPAMIPFMALLLYALHPIHVEVVASIKSRDTLLSAFFAFWAINYWLKNTGGLNWQKNLIISLLFLIALLSKEEALTIVAAVFLISFYFLNNDSYQSFKSTFPFLITATGYLVLRMIVLDPPTSNYDNLLNNIIFSLNGTERIATNLYIYLYYIRLLVFPHPLSWDYSFNQIPVKTITDLWVLTSAICFIPMIWYTLKNIRKRTITGFGILFYLVTFSIYSNIIPSITIGSTIGERFMFIPSLGFCIVLVYGLYLFLKTRNTIKLNLVFLSMSIFIGLIYTVKSANRIPVWQNQLTLCYSGIKDAPQSWRTHVLLGEELRLKALAINADTALLKQNKDTVNKTFQDAVFHYNLGYSIIDNKVKQLNYLQGLGECYLHLGDTAAAKATFIRSSENPKLFFAQFKLGMLAFNEKDYLAAVTYYQKALNADSPDVVSTCKNLGASYLSLKEYNQAIQAYEKALEYKSDPDIKSSLAMLYSSIGEFEKANRIMSNNTALTAEEKNFNNLMNGGIGAYNQGKYAEAIQYFKQCDPLFKKFGGYSKFPDFLNSWARSHLNIGQVIEAKAIFQRVIFIDPKNYYAMMNLGNIAFHNETDYSLATFYFSKCIETNSPDYFLSFSNLGTLYLIQNQPEKAIENYEKSLKYGTSEMVIRNLFLLWRSKGNQEKTVYYNALINPNGNRN